MTAYATVTQLREYLGQVKAGEEVDAQLTTVLARATDIVNDALGFEFAAWGAAATTRDVQAQGGCWLTPPAYKAGSIVGIEAVYGRGESQESAEAVSGWLADEQARPYRVYRGAGWGRGAWYRIEALWGYGAAPDAVVEVTIEVAVNIWRGRDAGNWQATVGADGQGAVSFNRALTWAQRSIIDGVRTRYLGVVHA